MNGEGAAGAAEGTWGVQMERSRLRAGLRGAAAPPDGISAWIWGKVLPPEGSGTAPGGLDSAPRMPRVGFCDVCAGPGAGFDPWGSLPGRDIPRSHPQGRSHPHRARGRAAGPSGRCRSGSGPPKPPRQRAPGSPAGSCRGKIPQALRAQKASGKFI